MKGISQPAMKEKVQEKSDQVIKLEKTDEKIEGNSTIMKVPHTSSHV